MLSLLAFAAIAAESPEAAFDRAVDAHYVAMQDKAVCDSGCKQAVVAKKSLGDAGVIELRKATADYGDVYAIVFGTGGAWFAADALDDIEEDDCGMGKCVSDQIASVSIMRKGDVAWVTLRVTSDVAHNWSHTSSTSHHQIVIGCKLGASPTCMTVTAGSHWEDGHAVIGTGSIHVVDSDGTRDLPFDF